jgi:hypothetical protein
MIAKLFHRTGGVLIGALLTLILSVFAFGLGAIIGKFFHTLAH